MIILFACLGLSGGGLLMGTAAYFLSQKYCIPSRPELFINGFTAEQVAAELGLTRENIAEMLTYGVDISLLNEWGIPMVSPDVLIDFSRHFLGGVTTIRIQRIISAAADNRIEIITSAAADSHSIASSNTVMEMGGGFSPAAIEMATFSSTSAVDMIVQFTSLLYRDV